MNQDGFQLELCSDLAFEEMVADISYTQQRIATINQDKGVDDMVIQFYFPPKAVSRTFPLNDLISILELAKKTLIECRSQGNRALQDKDE